MTDTLQALSSRRLTVLAGAGISVLPPSCLPSWWQLNHAVLDAMAGTARSVTALADTVVASVKEKQDAGRMPAEYTSEVIVDSLADEYFDVLGCLEGDQPNRVHAWLAALAKAKRLPAIITTNFDTLIERACEAVGAPVRVLVKPEEFADVDVAALLDDADAPLLLVKLHGSASDPATCIDTLAQRKRGLSEPVLRVVRELVEHTRLCILGWSGADLDAEPNYLYLRQSVSRPTPGFDWLMLPDATVLPAVTDLVALYDDESRARIVHGALPDWLEAWRAALDGTGVAAPAASASLDAEAARAAAVNSLQQAARAWAEARSPVTCGLVLGTLAERVDPQLGLQVREQLLESTARLEPDTRHHGIAEMHLASSLRAFGRNAEAAAHFREAVRIFRDREAIDAFGSALNEFANLLGDLGQYAEAEELYRESARISQAVDDELSHSMPLVNIARLRLKTGDYQAAMELAQEARAMATKAGEETERATTLEHIGLVLRDAGEIDEALASYREAEAIRTRLGQDTGLGYNLTHQAMILAGRAELDAARDVLARAEELAARTGQLRAQALVLLTRASIFTQTGQWSDAIASLREAIAVREQLSDPVGRLEVVISLVGMLASRGDSAAAMELGAPALQEAQARGLP
ncbi:MAG: tetratricopeptide repeat protein, partial [Planctomycetota bacterium]